MDVSRRIRETTAPLLQRSRPTSETWIRKRKETCPGKSLICRRLGRSRLLNEALRSSVEETPSFDWSEIDEQGLGSSIGVCIRWGFAGGRRRGILGEMLRLYGKAQH